ncbi:MAG: glycosyltransferase family 2 protein, partial [Chloroflexota bacterium]
MKPVVSVLMTTYNHARFLPMAVESVLAQTMPDFELVLGDNCSTDSTKELGEAFAARDQRVRYYRNTKNVGAIGGFNLCYERSHAESEYFAILSSDDWWEPTFLEEAV